MNVIDNILANLRRLFNMSEDATESEVDQRLEDEVELVEQATQDIAREAAESPDATEPAEEVQPQAQPTPAIPQEIQEQLSSLAEENKELRKKVQQLQEKHLAAAAAYEQEAVDTADKRDKYLCSTTRRAMA